jgi:NAD-dependent SIR2 family protein deacetylase
MRHGRQKHYTEIGIRRLPCTRCGALPSVHQWSVCADKNLQRPVCEKCDAEMNAMVLFWMNDPDAPAKLQEYYARQNCIIGVDVAISAARAATDAFVKICPLKTKKEGNNGNNKKRNKRK